MRLVTIETIANLTPIPESDNIEEAFVQGWGVVVRKGDFTVGDKCVYVPIDTLVDSDKAYFAHLKPKNGSKWVRVRSKKIRGVWSQGLVLPLSSLDLDDLVGVQKYTKEIVLTQINGLPAQKTDAFPTNIIGKTDEPNLRSNPRCVDELNDTDFYITKKMDGQSLTMIVDLQGNFIVCSRNLVLDVGSAMYQFIINENLEAKIRSLGFPVAIQCEYTGPRVNKNQMKLKKPEIFVFNIKKLTERNKPNVNDVAFDFDFDDAEDMIIGPSRCRGDYCGLLELQSLCSQMGVQMVPVLEVIKMPTEANGRLIDLQEHEKWTIQRFQEYANKVHEKWTIQRFQEYANKVHYEDPVSKKPFPGEGIVIRPIMPVWSMTLRKRLSVKVINQNYID